MKPLIKLSRITVLTACALWLIKPTLIVHAQLQPCPKFNIDDSAVVCPDCCTNSPAAQGWTDGTSDGAGIQTLTTGYVECGSPTTSCNDGTQFTGCGTQSYTQAVDDPQDCCLPSGTPCNQGTCCSGLVCLSNNSCGTCVPNGSYCGSSGDCCGGYCDPYRNTCGCLGDGNACYNDSECCSGICNSYGTCGSMTCGDPEDSCYEDSDCCSQFCLDDICQ